MVLYMGTLNLHPQGQWAAHAIPIATLPDPELASDWEDLLLKEKAKKPRSIRYGALTTRVASLQMGNQN